MEKSSKKQIDSRAYIRYLRKVTGEQVDTDWIRREVMAETKDSANERQDCE